MAIIINDINSNLIVENLKKDIMSGVIQQWVFDSDGDFTLTIPEMANRAWFHAYYPNVNSTVFGILGRKGVIMPINIYTEFHARLVKTLITHYGRSLRSICVTSPFENDYDTRTIEYRNE